jgi:phage tail-like protein
VTTERFAPGWLADQLPRALSEDHLTRQFLRIFEDVGESVRRNVVAFEHDLDVALGPMEFVRWMGSWLALAVPPSLPEPRQRELVAAAGAMWRRRGTMPAVVRLLEAVTGSAVEIDDGGGVFQEGGAPPNRRAVVVRLESRGGLTDEQLLELLRLEVPANASVEVEVAAGAEIPPPAELPGDEQ